MPGPRKPIVSHRMVLEVILGTGFGARKRPNVNVPGLWLFGGGSLDMGSGPGISNLQGQTAYVFAGDIDRLAMDFDDWTGALTKTLHEVILPSIRRNFAVEGRPKWAQLALSTAMSRIKQGYPGFHPILEREGKLKANATNPYFWELKNLQGGSGHDTIIFKGDTFTRAVPYGAFHQTGSTRWALRKHSLRAFIQKSKRGRYYDEETGSWFIVQGDPGSAAMTEAFAGALGVGDEGLTPPEFREGTFGDPVISKNVMPPRPWLMLQLEDEISIYDIFADFMWQKVQYHWSWTRGV